MSLLEKMRGDRRGWYKVSDLRPGVEIAVPRTSGSQTSNASSGSLTSSDVLWDEIVSITPAGREQVYDIEVEGTHNFVGNGIFAHNTYVLRANTMLAVDGAVHAGEFVVPMPTLPSPSALPSASSTLLTQIPPEVLTADGLGVDLYKLATYNFSAGQTLAARMDATDVRVTALEDRVDKLESGAISTASGSPLALSSSTLASALEGFGVLIQKGIAQFNTLVFRQLVASKDADGTSSAGSVALLAGNTVAQVNNSMVLPTTKVFVTFNSQITGSWWVSDKLAGSFRVVLSEAQAGDVSFDYFLVQTEGQIATSTPSANLEALPPSGGTTPSSDTIAPVITLLGDNPLHLSIGGTFVEPGVSITDPSTGSGQATIIDTYVTYVNGIEGEASAGTIDTGSEQTYIITYKATDARGNFSTANRSVIVGAADGAASGASGDSSSAASTDTTAPVVTLAGDAAMQLTVGDTFTDPGASATDPSTELGAGDTDLTSSIVVTGSVDTATEGSYTLTYTATDAAGNSASVSRFVTVVAPAAPSDGAAPDPAPAEEPAPAPASSEPSPEPAP